ncbi:hypothetical protein [Dyadobacter bucti]|uniref:hypothetical protein n=1 Tax=Dyadobacter bucti TaxID=2572203 RepID=UPI001109AE76|nr:hypothetical protein [Dyadobacter bucti]
MPWTSNGYPSSFWNQPETVRQKAVEIAKALLQDGEDETYALATGLRYAIEVFKRKKNRK